MSLLLKHLIHARFYVGAGGTIVPPNLSLPQIFAYSSSMQ